MYLYIFDSFQRHHPILDESQSGQSQICYCKTNNQYIPEYFHCKCIIVEITKPGRDGLMSAFPLGLAHKTGNCTHSGVTRLIGTYPRTGQPH